MTFKTIDLFFNIVLVMFWSQTWGSRQDFYNNFYLANIRALTQPLLDILRPATPWKNIKYTAFIFWLALICFRGLLPLAYPAAKDIWSLTWGFEVFTPSNTNPPFLAGLTFSLGSFAIFLTQLWALTFLTTFSRLKNSITDFLETLSQPLPLRSRSVGLLVILSVAAALTFYLRLTTGAGTVPTLLTSGWLSKLFINGLAGIANILAVLQQLILFMIIGSWISFFIGSQQFMFLCGEWLTFLLGPFRNRRIRIAILDLTPIVVYLLLSLAYVVLHTILGIIYTSIG